MDATIQVNHSYASATANTTLQSLLQQQAQAHAQSPAFTCLGHSLRYRDLIALSDHLAAWLQQESGLQPGDRVAVQLPNLLQYPVVALAVLKAGMVLVNINPLYTPGELQQQLQDSGARLLVVLANTAHNAAAALAASDAGKMRVEKVIITELFDLHPTPKRLLLNFMVRHIKKLIPAFHIAGALSFRQVMTRGAALYQQQGLQPVTAGCESLALLQYTGGTTGVAKGAMLTHGNFISNLLQLQQRFNGDYPPAGAVMVAPLPLYHIYAFSLGFLSGILHGHHTLLIPNPRDIPAFVKALRPWRINGFLGINTLYRLLCDNREFCALDFSALQLCSAGGMALSPQVVARWKQVTGCDIVEGYGLSECSPLLACNTPGDLVAGTVGKPLPGTQLVLLDAAGTEVATGQPGEICVKGPQVMQGYWQREEENALVFDVQGWFHTGDIAVQDAAGNLRIVDRLKDLIIVSGFNVYPTELEEHACKHPHIVDACAIGIGDDYSVQIMLVVVCSMELEAEAVRAWCRQGLAAYKVPRHIEFRTSLPKSPVGKVLRKDLRKEMHAAWNITHANPVHTSTHRPNPQHG